MPTTIIVTSDFRILVNFVQHGVKYSSKELANKEARQVKTTYYPTAKLVLNGETE